MNIFNSLGSNHTFASAARILFAVGGTTHKKNLAEYLESRYGGKAVLTYKGREALRLALEAIPGGGAVAINGFTCWAVYQAVQESNNTCHYLDISETSLNFTADALHDALATDPSIKAVVVQNTLGLPCDIERIHALCEEYRIALIEDLAHSIGTVYASGKEAGTVGDFVILSFSQDKVVDAVAGGALVVRNPKYQLPAYPSRAVPIRRQLKDRLYPLFTYVIRATHSIGLGPVIHRLLRFLHLLSRPLPDNDVSDAHELPGWYCATILGEYRALEKTMAHRTMIARIYAEKIDKRLQLTGDMQCLSSASNLRFPILHYERDILIEHLKSRHVYVRDIWYDAPIGPKRYLHRTDYRGQCPQAEEVARMMINLPTHTNISAEQAGLIATYVNEWLKSEGGNTYHVKPIWSEPAWERFLADLKPHSFLQSWKWGRHYEQTGSKIFRVGVYNGGILVGIALFIKIHARRGVFLVCPHGPLIANPEDEERALAALVHYCTEIARDEECDFIRFCPISPATGANRALYRSLGFRDAPIHMHPELSWILDISKPEEQLLKEMRKTTRYTIKKMEKDGVEITQSSDAAGMEQFWSVYEATFERQQFTPFSKNYLKTEFELYSKDGQAVFFFGAYKGEVVAAAIIIFYNGQAFYHHSGSRAGAGSNVSYLLQWRVIQEAKRRGCTLYNFWGIAPEDKPNHAWSGLSLFKKGFGGFAEAYLHAQDKPLTTRYALNYAIETVRRVRRHL
ncbi:peptidoglycan bridge formation glycyltransferase FemA/FemB family protein [Candidatus Kaiserbacteria bacterium]|nr:peptidoglycan bridge formation glycyltransferase FemA/FemB family protein [Candidatus Kaiserbacteria bacterium]